MFGFERNKDGRRDLQEENGKRRNGKPKEREMSAKKWLRIAGMMLGGLLIGTAHADIPTVPNALYEA